MLLELCSCPCLCVCLTTEITHNWVLVVVVLEMVRGTALLSKCSFFVQVQINLF